MALSGLKNIAEDAGRSAIGSPKAAMLIIHDYRDVKSDSTQLPAAIKKTSSKLSTFGNSAVASSREGGASSKTLKVQFNPKELQLYASSQSSFMADSQEEGKQQQQHGEISTKATINLTIPLIFDDVNIFDAFMLEKYTMGASASTITNAATMVASMAGKKWTVQPQVEGLLSALREPKTRKITFQWADFSFTGTLTAVNAQYTMFSVSGRPIRAEVSLRLQQEQDADVTDPWLKEYDKAFGSDSSSLVSAAQKVGSLLNFSL